MEETVESPMSPDPMAAEGVALSEKRPSSLWAFPCFFFLLSTVLALGQSNLNWLGDMNYVVLFSRYSVVRFVGIVTFAAIGVGLCASLAWRPRSTRGARLKAVSMGVLAWTYTLLSVFALTEFYFQRVPEAALGQEDGVAVHQLVMQSWARSPSDPEVGMLGIPNQSAPRSTQGDYDTRHLYAPAPWRDSRYPVVDYVSDSNGFRNDTDRDSADLVVLGDSFTHAVMIERKEIWSAVAATLLGVTECNLAYMGFCPSQEVIILKRHGLRLHPRVVLMQLYLGNDMPDTVLFRTWRTSGVDYVEFFRRRLNLAPMVLTAEFAKRASRIGGARATDILSGSPGDFDPIEVLIGGKRTPMGFLPELKPLLRDRQFWVKHPGRAPMFRAIHEANAACTVSGASFAVILIPTKTRIYYPLIANTESRDRFFLQQMQPPFPSSREEAEVLLPQRWDSQLAVIQAFLDRYHIHHLDLTHVLETSARTSREPLYFPLDSHWTAAGHKVAGEAVAEWLRDRIGLSPNREMDQDSKS